MVNQVSQKKKTQLLFSHRHVDCFVSDRSVRESPTECGRLRPVRADPDSAQTKLPHSNLRQLLLLLLLLHSSMNRINCELPHARSATFAKV